MWALLWQGLAFPLADDRCLFFAQMDVEGSRGAVSNVRDLSPEDVIVVTPMEHELVSMSKEEAVLEAQVCRQRFTFEHAVLQALATRAREARRCHALPLLQPWAVP